MKGKCKLIQICHIYIYVAGVDLRLRVPDLGEELRLQGSGYWISDYKFCVLAHGEGTGPRYRQGYHTSEPRDVHGS